MTTHLYTISGVPAGCHIEIHGTDGMIASGTADDRGVFRFECAVELGKAMIAGSSA